MKIQASFMVADDINSPIIIFVSLTVTRDSTVEIEGIIAFPLQQRLRERIATLLYMFTAYLAYSLRPREHS
jgi:hypothetical protein